MSSQNLRGSPLCEALVAAITQLLDSANIPSVLWGNYLLTVYGIPSISNDAAFVVPDDMVPQVPRILHSAGLDLCTNQSCIVVTVRARPPPINHFHLDTSDFHISIYPQSQMLPNVSDMNSTNGQIISATDPSLPKSRFGYGRGAFAPQYHYVRIPSAACFTEICLINYTRQARKKDFQCPQDLYFLGWASYMIEYVYPDGYLNLDDLQDIFREFMLDGFLKNDTASFVAARKKLFSSVRI